METEISSKHNEMLEVTNIEFERLCQDLGISQSMKTKAFNLWCDFTARNEEHQSNLEEKHCYVAVIYMAIVDTSMPYGPNDPHLDKQSPPCLTLTELLKKSSLNVIPFTKVMRTLREEINLSDAVLTHLSNVEKRYCIVSPLHRTFNRVWVRVFRTDENNTNGMQVPFTSMETIEYRKKLCWTLFIWAKENLLGDSQELVRAYNLLLCCMEFIIRSTPSVHLQEPFDEVKVNSVKNADQTGCCKAVLEKFAENFQTTFEDLNEMHLISEDFLLSLTNCNEELELKTIEMLYHDKYRRVGDLDELLFLQEDPHLIPDSEAVETPVPSSKETPVTPVRAAVNTVKQLKNILSTSESKPCEELKKYFQNCAANPEESITERLEKFKTEFIRMYCGIAGHGERFIAEQRFTMGTSLYYRIMHALLKMEQERLSQSDFSNLLHNETFHKSLLACSMEIVLVTFNMSWNPSCNSLGSEDSQFVFPWILSVFNLFAYDFYKVLESFIKAEPNLTRDIVKHLTSIENRILDHIAWKEGSPLHDAIAKCDSISTNLTSPSKDLTNGHGPARSSSSTSTAELYLSPFKDQQAKSPAHTLKVAASPRKTRPVTTVYSRQSPDCSSQETLASPKRYHSLNLFFNKVGRLGYQRLSKLSELLNVPRDIIPKIWTCFEYSITNRPDLLKNRHLDQIMMCSLYGICKVFNSEIKFKDIVRMYCNLPYTEPKTYKQVLLEGEEFDTVVMFYNRVFMPNMKNYILQFAKTVQPTLSPIPRPITSTLPASPRYSLPGKKNFHVSPMRESPFKSPGSMTPRSRQLYSFGEGIGSAEKLKNINDTLSAFKSRNGPYVTTPKSLKRLSFDNPEDNIQNLPGGSQERETPTIIIKKKRVTPPDLAPKQGNGIQDV